MHWHLIPLVLCGVLLTAAPAGAQNEQAPRGLTQAAAEAMVAEADPATLVRIVLEQSYEASSINLLNSARDRLAALGRADGAAVLPWILPSLQSPRDASPRTRMQRLNLMWALKDMGPAAADAVPVLVEIAEDKEERNFMVKAMARAALDAIGKPEAEADAQAAADRAEYRRLREAGDEEKLENFLQGLPGPRQIALAHEIARDPDPERRYPAAMLYVENGRMEEAVPLIADYIAASDRGPDLLTGLGWSMIHSDRSDDLEQIMTGITAHLRANFGSYTPAQKERIRRTLGPAVQGQE